MNEPKILQKLALAGIAGAALLAVPMKAEAGAFIIDDFNTGTTLTCTDNTANSSSVACAGTPVTGTNLVMSPAGTAGPAIAPGWSRSLGAGLNSGDYVTTEICAMCQVAHAVSSSGVPLAQGSFAWFYQGTSIDLTSYGGQLMFDYGADLNGATIEFSFTDNSGAQAITGLTLPGNEGVLTSYMIGLPAFNTTGQGYGDITQIVIRIQGRPGLDANLDNIKVIPEPLTMLGAGTAVGFGAFFKRKLKRKQDSDKA